MQSQPSSSDDSQAANNLRVQAVDDGLEFDVIAAPGSAQTALRAIHAGALKVALHAAPEKGKANAELIEFLAERLGIAKREVAVVRGPTARRKRVRVRGIGVAELRRRLA
ncbi:MAG: DUF167 domain-containing protein [Planctomycetota bacterium]